MQREEDSSLPAEGAQSQGHVEPLVPHHGAKEVAYQLGVGGVGSLGESPASLIHTALQLDHVVSTYIRTYIITSGSHK